MQGLYSYFYMLFRWSFKYLLILFLFLGVFSFFLAPHMIFVILALLLVFLFLYFSLKFPDGCVGLAGQYTPKSTDCDFLLVVSFDNIKKSSTKNDFFKQDWSLNWVNTLNQEVGNCSVLDINEFNKSIDKKSAIIISKSASSSLSDKDAGSLSNFVKKGGILILEQPGGNLREISGVKFRNDIEEVKTKKIDFVDSCFSSYFLLKGMPLNTFLKKPDELDDDINVYLNIDSYPAIFLKRNGEGAVLTFSFDYCMQLLSLQQGVPSNKYFVKSKNGLKGLIEPIDMLFSKKMLENKVPFADLLEKFIFEILHSVRPFPKFWYFPDAYSGTVIISHDEDYYGKNSIPMLNHEKALGAKSTFFLNSPTRLDKKTLTNFNVDVGIHWDKVPNLFSGLSFTKKSFSDDFKTQLKYISSKGFDVISNRTHFLMFGDHYTELFRILYNAGIKVDSTYGSNFKKGYYFGNGYGFYPLDTNGFIIPVLEVPFQIMDNRGGVDLSYIAGLLKDSKDKYHENISMLFHPIKLTKGKKLMKMWRDSCNLAKKNNHLIMTLKEKYNFDVNRGKSIIYSSFSKSRLEIIVDAKLDCLSLAVPLSFLGKRIKKTKDMALTYVMDSKFVLISLKKGMNNIVLPYT